MNEGATPETYIKASRRLAMRGSNWLEDWYVSHSPRNDNQNAEGPWAEWVELAKLILAENEKRTTTEQVAKVGV